MPERNVSIRDLNQNTSKVIHEVAAHHRRLTVTSSGVEVGVALVPIERGPAVLEELVAAGRASAPTVRGPIAAPPRHDQDVTDIDVATALADDREEERW